MNRHEAFEITGESRPGRWLVTCDHATNRVPDWLGGTLGIGSEDMGRHIAYDVGALGVALALGQALDSPVIASDFSRLVIDPNRGNRAAFHKHMALLGFVMHEQVLDHAEHDGIGAYKGRMLTYKRQGLLSSASQMA